MNGEASIATSEIKISDERPQPLFYTDLVGSLNPVAAQICHILAKELRDIGIYCDTHLALSEGFKMITRLAQNSQYDEGGWDISYYRGWKDDYLMNTGELMQLVTDDFRNREFPSDELENIKQSILNSNNYTSAKEDMYNWLKYEYDLMYDQPAFFYDLYPYVISTGLYGIDPVFSLNPLSLLEAFWNDSDYPGTNREVVLAIDGIDVNFNPALYTSWWTQFLINPVFDGLVGFIPSQELILPNDLNRTGWMIDNYDTTEYLDVYPRIATERGKFSKDGLRYNISIRDDVIWHDGIRLDAWDVMFSFQARLLAEINPSIRSRQRLRMNFGDDSKVNQTGVYSFIVEDVNSDGFYESITFNFPTNLSKYSFETDILGLPLLPEHILGDPINHGFNDTGYFNATENWLVLPIDWRYHSFNTGNNTDPGGLNGPIGCGSVIFEKFNIVNDSITMRKFEDIQWENESRTWITSNTSSDHYLITSGKLSDMPVTTKIVAMDFDSAVESVKNGSVNILQTDYFNRPNSLYHTLLDGPYHELSQLFKEFEEEGKVRPVHTVGLREWYISFIENPNFVTSTELGSTDKPFARKGVRHAISHVIPRRKIIENLIDGFGIPATAAFQFRYPGLPDNFLSFKQSVMAADGSYPEANATTIVDLYDRNLALDWLETEGYKVDSWRSYTPFIHPDWITDDTQQWFSRIKKDYSLEFKITNLRNENNNTIWFWEKANVTLQEGDTIKITWITDPGTDNVLEPGFGITQFGYFGPLEIVDYPISVSIGGKQLDEEHSRQFGWFILPLITTNGFGEIEPGFLSAERYFSSSFKLVDESLLSAWWMAFYFRFDVEGFPSIFDIGESATTGNEIKAHINAMDSSSGEDLRLFNLTYDARSGVLKKLVFTNVEGGDPSSGKLISWTITGLRELEITGPDVLPIASSTETSTELTTSETIITTPSSSSGYLIAIVIITISVAVMFRKKRSP
jgi:ABC-type transport system substrate-binding protein